MFKNMLLALCLFCVSAFFASAYAVGSTLVLLTNNTDTPLHVNVNLNSTDPDFKRVTDWDSTVEELEPYQSKQVLWFSRSSHIKENNAYQFNLTAIPDNDVAQDYFSFHINLKAHRVYGSEISSDIQFPDGKTQPVLTNYGLEHYPAHFWNADYTVHARRWKATTGLFSNMHIVIEKSDPVILPDTTSSLRVLSYNTQLQPFYGQVVNDLNEPALREQLIVPAIKNYDVLIFQELFDRNLRTKLTTDLTPDYAFHTRVVGDATSKAWTGGVMIFSKWPIEKEDQIVYQATTGADKNAAKGVAYAVINKNGMRYHVFGTHLEAGDVTDDVRVRRKQLAELNNFIERMNIPATEPVLIGGDMNIDEFSLEASTLYSQLHVAKLDNKGYQYSSDALVNTMSVGNDRERIDYVFYDTRHLVPVSAYNKVFILRALHEEKKWPKFDLSDHFPVAAYFDFAN